MSVNVVKGNPEFGHDQRGAGKRLLESVKLSQIVKRAFCDLCGVGGETRPVQFQDGIYNLCGGCVKEAEKK